jgi:predicted aspartyl protease
MDVNQGEVFKSSVDGVKFRVKKILRDMVVLESQDGKRQILTGTNTLTSITSVFQKVEGGES